MILLVLFSYNYSKQKQKRWRWRTHVPPSWAILMAMRTHWSNALGITQYSMTRDTLDAPGSCHWVTTCSILPRWPPGQQANNRLWKNTPNLLVVSIVMAMGRYDTVHIAWWRMSRAILDTTGHHHRESHCSDASNGRTNAGFCDLFHRQLDKKGLESTFRPLLTLGVCHIKMMRGI